jgi:membrane protein implicated in regulation of membrane protease activity
MVRKIRILWNIVFIGALFSGLLGLIGADIAHNLDALCFGILGGNIHGFLYWQRLFHRVERQHRRFDRNRIFVHFLSLLELFLTAITWSFALLLVLVLLTVAAFFLDVLSGHWWGTLAASFGISAAVVVGSSILRYERHYGPLYYQYDSRTWLGGEGLLYQQGKVIESLAPQGRIRVQGELWNAISLSNENIEAGRMVEVIARKGLTLYVEALPQDSL